MSYSLLQYKVRLKQDVDLLVPLMLACFRLKGLLVLQMLQFTGAHPSND